MIKYFYYLLISLVLVLFQQSVLGSFGALVNLNFLLVFFVFLTIVFGFNLGFAFAVFIGFFLDIYFYLPFGTFIIIYLLILTVVNALYKHVLINFSLYTNLILISLATILYGLLLVLFNFVFYLLGLVKIYIVFDLIYIFNLIWQIFFNSILMILFYFVAKVTIKKLNLVFLFKK